MYGEGNAKNHGQCMPVASVVVDYIVPVLGKGKTRKKATAIFTKLVRNTGTVGGPNAGS